MVIEINDTKRIKKIEPKDVVMITKINGTKET